MKLPTTDGQKETKSTFEKIADFSHKNRKDDAVDDDDDVDEDVAGPSILTTPLCKPSSSILSTPQRKLKKFLILDDSEEQDEDFDIIMLEPISIVKSPAEKKVTFPKTVAKIFSDADEIKSLKTTAMTTI